MATTKRWFTVDVYRGEPLAILAKNKTSAENIARREMTNQYGAPKAIQEIHLTTEKEMRDHPMAFRHFAKKYGIWRKENRNPFSLKKTVKKAGQQAKQLAPLLMVGAGILVIWYFLKNKA